MTRAAPVAAAAIALCLAWALPGCARPAADADAPAATQRTAARPAAPQRLTGESIAVQDGDSFVLRTPDGRKLRIRIEGIDAPERSQPFADVSRRHLARLLEGRRLTLQVTKTDPFGRQVARVTDGADLDAGLEQLQAGMAWFFRRYAAEQAPAQRRDYAQAEAAAREAGLGLWRDPQPQPPWEFRRRQRGR